MAAGADGLVDAAGADGLVDAAGADGLVDAAGADGLEVREPVADAEGRRHIGAWFTRPNK